MITSNQNRTVRRWISIVGAALIVLAGHGLQAATGTLLPAPWLLALDAAGNPISGAKACFYTAGTSTLTTTYSDVNLTTPNSNPVQADTAGRVGPVFLASGVSVKLILQDATGTAGVCNGVTLRTQDNISAVPGTSAGVDLTGTAGEALTAGQAVYLSDGSGGKTAGQWYKADSANAYSSTTNAIGVVPASITSGSSGTIRVSGSVTGLISLTVGGVYYVGTAGAMTLTAPANKRVVGQADTTTTLIVGDPPTPPVPVNAGLVCGRLTLTTAVPVTTADVTAATTLYYTPTSGCNQVTVWNSALVTDTLTETSVAVPATTSTMYDVFAFDNAGAINIEVLAWANDTTRATAITLQNGFLAKAATPARRYIGSFRTTTVSGQTEDSAAKRYVWNYYNRVMRPLRRLESTASWTYTTAAWRQANAAAANQLDVVIGVAEVAISLEAIGHFSNSAGALYGKAGIGEDSTSTPSANAIGMQGLSSALGLIAPARASLLLYPTIGRHFYAWLEYSQVAGTTTWYGVQAGDNTEQSGIVGEISG